MRQNHKPKVWVYDTPAHVVEPKYPGAVDHYINLDAFYDTESLKAHKKTIIEIDQRHRLLMKRAGCCIKTAADMLDGLYEVLQTEEVQKAVYKRAKGIISREIKNTNRKTGRISVRFLSAFSDQGNICRFDSIATQCRRVYVVENNLGFSDMLLSVIAEAAMNCGYDILLCLSPIMPDKIEHLMIPKLSLAFVSQTSEQKYSGPVYRHLKLDTHADHSILRTVRSRIRFGKKISQSLFDEAQSLLVEAKIVHEELDAVYNPYVDFTGVSNLAEDHIGKLLAQS